MRKVLIVALMVLALAALRGVREYGVPGKTQNGGITYGNCGVELWGEPGHFCNND
jgi:hypothetical protein